MRCLSGELNQVSVEDVEQDSGYCTSFFVNAPFAIVRSDFQTPTRVKLQRSTVVNDKCTLGVVALMTCEYRQILCEYSGIRCDNADEAPVGADRLSPGTFYFNPEKRVLIVGSRRTSFGPWIQAAPSRDMANVSLHGRQKNLPCMHLQVHWSWRRAISGVQGTLLERRLGGCRRRCSRI